MELVETATFTRQITTLLSDEEYAVFQTGLVAHPEHGAVIRGSGGIRKTRVAIRGRGKRGGARVIYYWAVRKDTILLLFAYAKNESPDMTPRQVSQLARLVKEEFTE